MPQAGQAGSQSSLVVKERELQGQRGILLGWGCASVRDRRDQSGSPGSLLFQLLLRNSSPVVGLSETATWAGNVKIPGFKNTVG